MTRFFAVLSSLLLVALLGTRARAAEPINVVATLSDFGKIAEAVGGDKVRVSTIARACRTRISSIPNPATF
jgi:ABC-type Zn uptake system ZnuABC Zn-binding protein ZnuA